MKSLGQYGDPGEDVSINTDRFSENFRVNTDRMAVGREVCIVPKIRGKEVRIYDTSEPGSLYSHCNIVKVVFLGSKYHLLLPKFFSNQTYSGLKKNWQFCQFTL